MFPTELISSESKCGKRMELMMPMKKLRGHQASAVYRILELGYFQYFVVELDCSGNGAFRDVFMQ